MYTPRHAMPWGIRPLKRFSLTLMLPQEIYSIVEKFKAWAAK
jgi:hypothetical protein